MPLIHCDSAIAMTPTFVFGIQIVIRLLSSKDGLLTPDSRIGIAAMLIISDIEMNRSNFRDHQKSTKIVQCKSQTEEWLHKLIVFVRDKIGLLRYFSATT